MITKTLSGWPYDFALETIRIDPARIDSIGSQFAIVLLVFFELFLIHEFAPVVSDQIAVLDVGIEMLLVLRSDGEFVLHNMF